MIRPTATVIVSLLVFLSLSNVDAKAEVISKADKLLSSHNSKDTDEIKMQINLHSDFNRTGTIVIEKNSSTLLFKASSYSVRYARKLSEASQFTAAVRWPSILSNFDLETLTLDFSLTTSWSLKLGRFLNPFAYYNSLPLDHYDRITLFPSLLPERDLIIEAFPYSFSSITGLTVVYDRSPLKLQLVVADNQFDSDGIKTNRVSKSYVLRSDFDYSSHSKFGLSYFNYQFNTEKLEPRTIKQNSLDIYYRFENESVLNIIEYMLSRASNKIYLHNVGQFKEGENAQSAISYLQAHKLSNNKMFYFQIKKRSAFYFATHYLEKTLGLLKDFDQHRLRIEAYANWFGKNSILFEKIPEHGLRLGITSNF